MRRLSVRAEEARADLPDTLEVKPGGCTPGAVLVTVHVEIDGARATGPAHLTLGDDGWCRLDGNPAGWLGGMIFALLPEHADRRARVLAAIEAVAAAAVTEAASVAAGEEHYRYNTEDVSAAEAAEFRAMMGE